jgi:hypothetical protein
MPDIFYRTITVVETESARDQTMRLGAVAVVESAMSDTGLRAMLKTASGAASENESESSGEKDSCQKSHTERVS